MERESECLRSSLGLIALSNSRSFLYGRAFIRQVKGGLRMSKTTFHYGGVGFIVTFTMESYKQWEIDEIYPDDGATWPYPNGLYDIVREDVHEAANDAIFEICHEAWNNRRDGMDQYKAQLEKAVEDSR